MMSSKVFKDLSRKTGLSPDNYYDKLYYDEEEYSEENCEEEDNQEEYSNIDENDNHEEEQDEESHDPYCEDSECETYLQESDIENNDMSNLAPNDSLMKIRLSEIIDVTFCTCQERNFNYVCFKKDCNNKFICSQCLIDHPYDHSDFIMSIREIMENNLESAVYKFAQEILKGEYKNSKKLICLKIHLSTKCDLTQLMYQKLEDYKWNEYCNQQNHIFDFDAFEANQVVEEDLEELSEEQIETQIFTSEIHLSQKNLDLIRNNDFLRNRAQRMYETTMEFIDGTQTTDDRIALKLDIKGKEILLVVDEVTNIHSQSLVYLKNFYRIDFENDPLLSKAGKPYKDDCLNWRRTNQKILEEMDILTTSAGDLPFQETIIYANPPFRLGKTQNQFLSNLKEFYLKLFKEADNLQVEQIAIPLDLQIYQKDQEIMAMMQGIFESMSTIEKTSKIYLCHPDHNKLFQIKEKILNFISKYKNPNLFDEVTYQFQWNLNGEWKDFDNLTNQTLTEAYLAKQKKVDITYPLTHSPASHRFDLFKNQVLNIGLGVNSKLSNKPNTKIWILDNEVLDPEVCNLIEMKRKQKEYKFDLFLNKYEVDLERYVQINKQTKFERQIQILKKRIKNEDQENYEPSCPIHQGLMKITQFEFSKIILKSENEDNLDQVEILIEKELKHSNLEKVFELPQYLPPKYIDYLKIKLSDEKVTVVGKIIEGSKITCRGSSNSLTAIENFLNPFYKSIFPPDWVHQDENCKLIEINSRTPEFEKVKKVFEESMISKTMKIWRIQNKTFYTDYLHEIEKMKKIRATYNLPLNINEKCLWHGTREHHPEKIYNGNEESFKLIYARDGMWGKGLYFAADANYSDSYAHVIESTKTKLMMQVKVITGDCIEMTEDSSIIEPPKRDDIPYNYDSIKGNTQWTDVYILKVSRRAYPLYLVEYS